MMQIWRIHGHALTVAALLLLLAACVSDDDDQSIADPSQQGVDLRALPYEPQPYTFVVPDHFPRVPQPDSNLATAAGVALGRMIFFDPILSRDSTFSCASCHEPALAFTDEQNFSLGIDGERTARSAMSLFNVAYHTSFFWDGRSGTLEEQSLHPVEDIIELASEWPDVERRLRRLPRYQAAFRAAFGVENSSEIDRYLVAKAIAQFERTLISGTSKYDRVTFALSGFFTDEEESGRELFFTEPTREHPGCAHCHNAPLFGDQRFSNNGIDSAETTEDFADFGRGNVTGNRFDNGKFKAPTLRNIAVTAPYMHDGRFETLDQVLEHYASGGHYSPTRDPNITGFRMSNREREQLKAFLRTLTDTSALRNPAFRPLQ